MKKHAYQAPLAELQLIAENILLTITSGEDNILDMDFGDLFPDEGV